MLYFKPLDQWYFGSRDKDKDVLRFLSSIYNATIQNNRKIDRVHNYELYIATVSINYKSVDRIKTALRFWLNATR